jgi:hypothetical protein
MPADLTFEEKLDKKFYNFYNTQQYYTQNDLNTPEKCIRALRDLKIDTKNNLTNALKGSCTSWAPKLNEILKGYRIKEKKSGK